MDLAIKDVQRHVGKFVATIVGVGMLFSMVLMMNGLYRGNYSDAVWLIGHTPTDLWVVERYSAGPFSEQSRLPEDVYKSVAAVPGVGQASPFITYSVQREIRGTVRSFSIIGYDVFGGLGGPQRVVAGRPVQHAHYELVTDMKLGLRLEERVHLGLHDFTVVGLTKGVVDFGGNPVAYVSIADAQEILFQQDNEALRASRAATLQRLERAGNTPEEARRLLALVSAGSDDISAVLVRVRPGADAGQVAERIRDWLYLNVYTQDAERQLMLKGRILGMITVLAWFRALLITVSIVMIALLIYVLTMEKLKAIATLKLMGASNTVIVRLVLEQSLVITIAAFVVAYVAVSLTYERLPRTLVLLSADTRLTFAVIFVGGIAASALGIWQALRTPPSLALGG